MVISVNLKKIGKKKNKIEKENFHLENNPKDVRELLIEVVKASVSNYIDEKDNVIDYLDLRQIKDKEEAGKITNGQSYDDRIPNLDDAIQNAISSFEDGIVRVFLEGVELVDLDQELNLVDGSSVTFVKMVMLAGRIW
ncbi:MAG: hypothetical protein ACI4PU_04735 [Intestinibacter sp.]